MREIRISATTTLAVVALLGLVQHAANAQVQQTREVFGSVLEYNGGPESFQNAHVPPIRRQQEAVKAVRADQYLVSNIPAARGYASSGGSLRGDVWSSYDDGAAFGFQKGRLYNPLDGPTLNLHGRPTVDTNFGQCDSCDKWAGMCHWKDLDYGCDGDCAGLKAKPGHLGLPWLGSKDNCDQTVPVFGRRKCKECAKCSSCGG